MEKNKTINEIVNNILRGFVLVLFLFLFIGRLNPARISETMNKNVSLIKSAFYFKSFTSGLVEAATQSGEVDAGELENPFEDFEKAAESDSWDDFYAAFAAMGEDTFGESDELEDDDSEFTFDKAEKIIVPKYKEVWAAFELAHPEIAEVVKFDRLASILTFAAIIITLLGLYLSYGTKLYKKIGFIITAAGSSLTALSLVNFTKAYDKLMSSMDMFDPLAVEPSGTKAFISICILIFVFSILSIAADKLWASESELQISEKSTINATPFQYTFRIITLLLFILLFIPGANVARISENINRNVSLFTSAFSYSTYTENLQRELLRGWLPSSVMKLGHYGSLLFCLGIVACSAGACMSVGNNRLKKYAHFALLGGSVTSFGSLFMILRAYDMIKASPNVEKLLPLEPASIGLYFVLVPLVFICTLISMAKTPAPEPDEKCHIDAPYQLFLMLLPFLILVFIFSYLPLWGWRFAFFDYNAGDTLSMDAWVGWKWFKLPFENAKTGQDVLRVLRNTLVMSGLGIGFSWLPMLFAIFLTEIRNTKTRKIIQTLTTIPNFISWVLVYAIAFCIFGTEGFVSSFMTKHGFWESGVNQLMESGPEWAVRLRVWFKMWLWGTWKGLGWSAIMYIAAISGIDQQLYEAATVDGAGRFQKIWHITMPELFPTYIVLLILSVSNILSNGMDQYLVFKNTTNKDAIEVLDLYVYQLSFGQTSNSNIPFSTVVSMLKSLVSVVLLFVTNKISKWIRGSSIF